MVNGLQLLDTWQGYFGAPEGAKLGLLAAGNRLGQIASIPLVSPLIQRLGRRWPILIGSAIILVGVAIQASAQSFAMFTVGRVIIGKTHAYLGPISRRMLITRCSKGSAITYKNAPVPYSYVNLPTHTSALRSLLS